MDNQSARCVTRREAVFAGLGLLALTALGGIGVAFAADGGGGGGSVGGGDSSESVEGRAFIWFDRGGTYGEVDPAQGWDDDSSDYFLEIMEDYMGGELRGKDGTGYPHRQKYYDACDDALARARKRSGQAHARIVAVGWCWFRFDYGPGFGLYHGNDFDQLIKRKGNLTELPNKYGWNTEVDSTKHNDAKEDEVWRDYVYRIGRVDCPGSDYSVVVIAVASGEPQAKITIPVTKSWVADAGYTDNRPDSVTFTLTGSDGSKKSLTVKAPDYEGTFKDIDPNLTYTLTEASIPGYTSAVKRVNKEDIEKGFAVTNTLETTQRSVRKVWSGDERATQYRPSSVTVYLVGSDGSRRPATLSAENGWVHTWTGLIKTLSDGTEVVYTVEEDVPEHYEFELSTEGETGFVVMNTMPPEPAEMTKEPSEPTWL